ncbi:MAG: hypothetical protein JO110_10340, partial [Acetobacteraceae bacterium]|nr:hypothetical protein [Acetobacteraceae bacterium]
MSHHRQSAESVNGVTGVTGHAKPAKPYPDFPLFPHATRRWAKKIRGKMHYFGPWEDWQGALNRYLEQKDDLYAGRTPRVSTGVSVRLYELNNSFLAEKRRLFDTGEIGQRTLADYEATCDLVGQQFGLNRAVEDLTPKDFADLRDELARRWGPVRLGNEINRIRILFRHGGEDASGLLTKTVRFGTGFKRPSKKTLRLERAAKNPRFFEPECLRQLLAAAEPPLT